ncbi:thimet oligopeptidase [Catenaria anguillulae PL171]|uniref:Thimet oligopeptidase n=1 Tax=Catenaria anguillulae PL171 TaxID=765915 RepID=A0A1Y2HVW1_9FUNG|nr:thimet oligopeptidase [Catenaria anguillulae PL171]
MTQVASTAAPAGTPIRPLAPAPTDLHFALSTAEVKATADKVLAISNKVFDEIAALSPEQCTFESVILRLARLENMVNSEVYRATFVQYFSPDKESRDASQAVTMKLEEFEIESSMREDLYLAVKHAAEKLPAGLKKEDERLVERMLLQYERNGLALPVDKRNELKDIKKRISELAIQFSRNKAEDKSFVEVTKEDLEGLPDDYINGLTKLDNGNLKVTMSYPDRLPIMRKAKNADVRRRVDEASTRMAPENIKLLEETVHLRAKAAALLGYKNHAEFKLQIQMAKNPEAVLTFLNDLKTKLTVLGEREKVKLLELKQTERAERGLPEENELFAWDFMYYNNLMVEREFNVDFDEVAKYFSFERVTAGMLDFYSRLLGVTFTETKDVKTWHEDVSVYTVHDTETGRYIGTFFLDLFPREGAYTHAAVFPIRPSCELADGGKQSPVAAMKCNFTKPTADTPSLFKHDEVVTYYHEFGHVMHTLLSSTKYSRFHGTSVATDFVEAPSQMLENFVWQPTILKKLSSHWQTGEPIPDELVERLVKTEHVNDGLFNLRQLFFGLYDMNLHTRSVDDSKDVDSTKLYNDMFEEITLVKGSSELSHRQSTFDHIMGGYDAGYYSYLWSKVFASDIFTRFEKEGLENAQVGRDYRDKVLLPGASKDEMSLIVDFLGREPNPDAFLKAIGL